MGLVLHESAKGRPLADIIKDAGITGCGGAGFPTYAKYDAPQEVLVVNAQESEPGYFIDKWIHKTHVDAFVDLFGYFKDWGIKKVVVGAKDKDRAWFEGLVSATGAAVVDSTGRNRTDPHTLEQDVVFSFTDDRYAFGKEGALLLVVAQTKIPPGEYPKHHGYIVNNSQTLLNIHQALTTNKPVTRKYVHVFGETPRHVFLDVPVGTPVADLFEEAGTSVGEVETKGFVVVEGGPGWFHKVDPGIHAVTRRTNSILVIDPAFRDPNGKDVLPGRGQEGYPRRPETEMAKAPSPPGDIPVVRVPLIDNPDFAGVVKPGVPSVEVGREVSVGDVIAKAADEGFSLPCHASIAGKVSSITEHFIEISR